MQRNRAIVRLSYIRENAEKFAALAGGAKLCAVVKADAYGHGAETVAPALEGVADCFAVALVGEGAALRLAGVRKDVLVLVPPLCEEEVLRGISYGLIFTVGDAQDYALIASVCKKYGLCARCHIKANTGMNRYGCNLSQLPDVLDAAKDCGANIVGLFSHMYGAHIARERESQLAVFNRAEELVKRTYPQVFCHISASAGAMLGGEYLKNGVRCGIALYGYAPYGFSREGLERALTVYARKVQTSPVCGRGVGYAVAERRYENLSAYRCGYADGFFRGVPLGEGNLCMDAFVSRDTRPLVPVFTDADEYAARCGTISYEVLCSVTRRSERVYICD